MKCPLCESRTCETLTDLFCTKCHWKHDLLIKIPLSNHETCKTIEKLIGTRWQRKEQNESYPYNGYTVLMVTNLLHEHPSHPPQVIYKGDNGKEWSLELHKWPGSLEPETESNSKKAPVVIDLEKEAWLQIKAAALKSNWIPADYFINDWVSDVCHYLTHGYKYVNDTDKKE